MTKKSVGTKVKVFCPDCDAPNGEHYSDCLINQPDTEDGLDKDGFPGGDRRFNVWPTTFESAKQALLDFVPKSQRREYEDILGDVFMDMDMEAEEESDEEE